MTPTPYPNVPHHPVFTPLWGPVPYWMGVSPEGQIKYDRVMPCDFQEQVVYPGVLEYLPLEHWATVCEVLLLQDHHAKEITWKDHMEKPWDYIQRTMTHEPPAVPGSRHLSQSDWGPRPWEQKWACPLCHIWIPNPQNQNKSSTFGDSMLSNNR